MVKKNNTTSHQAKDYDDHIHCTIPYYSSLHKETINIIKAVGNEPETWLDTGCGTGSLIKMARHEFPKTEFILSDPSEDMLDQAQDKLKNYPIEKLKFLEPSPSQDLNSKSCKNVDVITSIQSHHYLSVENREKAVKACYELLKDNGIFIVFENIRPFTDDGTIIGMKNWKNFQLSCGRDENTVNDHLKRFDVEFFPITVEEHLNLLNEAGFKIVELLWFSYMQAGFYAIK